MTALNTCEETLKQVLEVVKNTTAYEKRDGVMIAEESGVWIRKDDLVVELLELSENET